MFKLSDHVTPLRWACLVEPQFSLYSICFLYDDLHNILLENILFNLPTQYATLLAYCGALSLVVRSSVHPSVCISANPTIKTVHCKNMLFYLKHSHIDALCATCLSLQSGHECFFQRPSAITPRSRQIRETVYMFCVLSHDTLHFLCNYFLNGVSRYGEDTKTWQTDGHIDQETPIRGAAVFRLGIHRLPKYSFSGYRHKGLINISVRSSVRQ